MCSLSNHEESVMKSSCFKPVLSAAGVIFAYLFDIIKPSNQLVPQMKARKNRAEGDMGKMVE